MKLTAFSIAFLLLIGVVLSSGFFFYTGQVIRYSVKSDSANLVLDYIIPSDNLIYVEFCNNGRKVINNKAELTIEIEGSQISPISLTKSKKTYTKNYNLLNFGRKCIEEKINVNYILNNAEFKNSKIKATISAKGIAEISYKDNSNEIGYYNIKNGKISRVGRIIYA